MPEKVANWKGQRKTRKIENRSGFCFLGFLSSRFGGEIHMAKDITQPDPGIVLDLLQAFRCSKIMFAAVALGVFDALGSTPKTLRILSEELEVNPDALERLLDACVGLQLLDRDEQAYRNTPVASTYLLRSSPYRLTGYINFSNSVMWKLWGNLEDAVREGTHRWRQTFGWDGPIFSQFFRTEESKREFLMGMHGYGLISSPQVVAAFDLSQYRCLVDLGGATGHLAIAACERYRQLKAIVFDLPEAVPLAREIVGASPVAQRIEVLAGDFFVDPLPQGDLYTVGRILHDWSEEKVLKLLSRVHEHLPSRGAILIAEKLLEEGKRGPRWAHLQNLNMLAVAEGKERTLSEYEALLHHVGFAEVVGCRTSSPLDAVLAIKR
jgi:acetylserotonin O-methyltransferase